MHQKKQEPQLLTKPQRKRNAFFQDYNHKKTYKLSFCDENQICQKKQKLNLITKIYINTQLNFLNKVRSIFKNFKIFLILVNL